MQLHDFEKKQIMCWAYDRGCRNGCLGLQELLLLLQIADACEQRIHKRAKADHEKTCQALQDHRSAMQLAIKQHDEALKQVQNSCKETTAKLQADSAQFAADMNELHCKMTQGIQGLRKKYNLT